MAFDVFFKRDLDRLPLGIGDGILEAGWSHASAPGTVIGGYYREEAVDNVAEATIFLLRPRRWGGWLNL